MQVSKREWGPLEDYILAQLNLLFGFGNHYKIQKHPAWHLTRVKDCIPSLLKKMAKNTSQHIDEVTTISEAYAYFVNLYVECELSQPGSEEGLFKQTVMDSLCYLHFKRSRQEILAGKMINCESVYCLNRELIIC